MKFGIFADVHARLDNPSCRTDFFPRAILAKLDAMGDIWKREQVDVVLNLGDTTHIPSPSLSLVHDLSRVFRDWQLPIITITGSHDVHGYQSQTLRRTAVGVLEKAGILYIIGATGFPPYVDMTESIRIYGTSHTPFLTDSPNNFAVHDEEHDSRFIIHMVHGDLLDKPVPWPHVLISQVKTDAHYILAGHYHPGWPHPKDVTGGHTFFNPGSVGRIERGHFRIPRVAILDISGMKSSLSCIIIPSVENPFGDKDEMPKEEVMVDVTRFLSILDQAQVDVVDVKGKIPILGKELGLSEEIIDKTIQILEELNEHASQ